MPNATLTAQFHWRCPGCGGLASTFTTVGEIDPVDGDRTQHPECGPCALLMEPFALHDPSSSHYPEGGGPTSADGHAASATADVQLVARAVLGELMQGDDDPRAAARRLLGAT